MIPVQSSCITAIESPVPASAPGCGSDLILEDRFSYRQQLFPWCVVQLLPQMQRVTIARFRKRSQAEEHTKVLQRLRAGSYAIVFAPPDRRLLAESMIE